MDLNTSMDTDFNSPNNLSEMPSVDIGFGTNQTGLGTEVRSHEGFGDPFAGSNDEYDSHVPNSTAIDENSDDSVEYEPAIPAFSSGIAGPADFDLFGISGLYGNQIVPNDFNPTPATSISSSTSASIASNASSKEGTAQKLQAVRPRSPAISGDTKSYTPPQNEISAVKMALKPVCKPNGALDESKPSAPQQFASAAAKFTTPSGIFALVDILNITIYPVVKEFVEKENGLAIMATWLSSLRSSGTPDTLSKLLSILQRYPNVSSEILKTTGVGKLVNEFATHNLDSIAQLAKSVVSNWRSTVQQELKKNQPAKITASVSPATSAPRPLQAPKPTAAPVTQNAPKTTPASTTSSRVRKPTSTSRVSIALEDADLDDDPRLQRIRAEASSSTSSTPIMSAEDVRLIKERNQLLGSGGSGTSTDISDSDLESARKRRRLNSSSELPLYEPIPMSPPTTPTAPTTPGSPPSVKVPSPPLHDPFSAESTDYAAGADDDIMDVNYDDGDDVVIYDEPEAPVEPVPPPKKKKKVSWADEQSKELVKIKYIEKAIYDDEQNLPGYQQMQQQQAQPSVDQSHPDFQNALKRHTQNEKAQFDKLQKDEIEDWQKRKADMRPAGGAFRIPDRVDFAAEVAEHGPKYKNIWIEKVGSSSTEKVSQSTRESNILMTVYGRPDQIPRTPLAVKESSNHHMYDDTTIMKIPFERANLPSAVARPAPHSQAPASHTPAPAQVPAPSVTSLTTQQPVGMQSFTSLLNAAAQRPANPPAQPVATAAPSQPNEMLQRFLQSTQSPAPAAATPNTLLSMLQRAQQAQQSVPMQSIPAGSSLASLIGAQSVAQPNLQNFNLGANSLLQQLNAQTQQLQAQQQGMNAFTASLQALQQPQPSALPPSLGGIASLLGAQQMQQNTLLAALLNRTGNAMVAQPQAPQLADLLAQIQSRTPQPAANLQPQHGRHDWDRDRERDRERERERDRDRERDRERERERERERARERERERDRERERGRERDRDDRGPRPAQTSSETCRYIKQGKPCPFGSNCWFSHDRPK